MSENNAVTQAERHSRAGANILTLALLVAICYPVNAVWGLTHNLPTYLLIGLLYVILRVIVYRLARYHLAEVLSVRELGYILAYSILIWALVGQAR